jgi:hypothetical protein
MVKAYFRCNGGDYFEGGSCPFDGWSAPEVREFLDALRTLTARNQPPSMEAFRTLGLGAATLKQIIVIEFGSEAAVFEALSKRLYLKDGVERKPGNLGADLS